MKLDEAMKWAEQGVADGLLGAYPTAAKVLAEEVYRLRAQIYLSVMDERNACIGICSRYKGQDSEVIADEIAARK